ncbi:MAG: hypothetical protein CMC09_02820, partial [Flavobacteriaceae bacterium]|nr:hypothetical protein [Flavobacteriaceae bacterium]
GYRRTLELSVGEVKADNLLRDKLGWVDDFRALPGKCGQPLTQKIYVLALMQQGTSPEKLKEMIKRYGEITGDDLGEVEELILE